MIVFEDGENDWTLEGTWATSFGITESIGLENASLSAKPEPTSVQPGWSTKTI